MLDPYYDAVSLLLPMKGANNGTLFPDYSKNLLSLVKGTTIKTVTTQSRFYGSSGYFDGYSTGYLTAPAGSESAFTFGVNDFTLEFWIMAPALPGTRILMDFRGPSQVGAYPSFYINGSGDLQYFYKNQNRIVSAAALTVNVWAHVALSRASGTTRFDRSSRSFGIATWWPDFALR